jgi:hypothetical protein
VDERFARRELEVPAPLPSEKRPSKLIFPAGRDIENCTFAAVDLMSAAVSPLSEPSDSSKPITLFIPRLKRCSES